MTQHEAAQGIPASVRSRLPKARLLSLRWIGTFRRPLFIKTRGANFAAVWIGPLQIIWRMPWLPESARALHPQLFAKAPSTSCTCGDSAMVGNECKGCGARVEA